MTSIKKIKKLGKNSSVFCIDEVPLDENIKNTIKKPMKKPLSTFSLTCEPDIKKYYNKEYSIKEDAIKKPLEKTELITNVRNEFEDAVDRLLKNLYTS